MRKHVSSVAKNGAKHTIRRKTEFYGSITVDNLAKYQLLQMASFVANKNANVPVKNDIIAPLVHARTISIKLYRRGISL